MSDRGSPTVPVLATGRPQIDQHLSGIGAGALVVVEGRHATGKSVLCQHLARHALNTGLGVVYYSSEEPSPSLLTRAASLGLDLMDHFLLDRLRIYPLETWGGSLGPSPLLDRVARHLGALPPYFSLVVVDSLSALMPHSPREPLLAFLEHCRRLCGQGKTVVLVVDSGPGLDWALARLSAPPEARLHLRLAAVEAGRTVLTLEAHRPGQHPEWPAPPVAFRVEAGAGIRVIHWRQFRLPAGAWRDAADLLNSA